MGNIKNKIFDVSSIGISDIIGSGVAAIFWLYLASELGPEKYGEITFLISIASFVSGLALFGSHNTILVFTAKKIDVQSTIYSITIISNILGSIAVFILFANLGVSLIILAYAMFSMVMYDLLGRKQYKNYAKYVIIQKIQLIVFGLGFYYIFGENGILLGIALSHIHLIYQIVKSIKNSKFNLKIIQEKKEFFLNNFLLSVARTFYGNIDKLIIVPLLGYAVLGNYSLGIQFFQILNLLPTMAIKYFVGQDVSGIPNKKLKRIMIIASVGAAVLGSTVAPTIISQIFPRFLEAEEIIRIISLTIIPLTIQATYYTPKLWALEKNRIILFHSIIVVCIQISGIVILGSFYEVFGVATAFLVSNIVGCTFLAIVDKKFLSK